MKLPAAASRARVSLATIYKLFSTREELIIAAFGAVDGGERVLRTPKTRAGISFADGQLWAFHRIFDPWQEHPPMLEYFTCHVFARVATGDLSVSELLALLERVVHPLTANDEELAAGPQRPLPSSARGVLEDT